MAKRTIIIGDVHGCGEELQALINKIAPTPEDELILVGDAFDRGFCGHLAWQLIQKYNIGCVLGNHEVKMLEFITGHRPQGVPPHYLWTLHNMINVTKVVRQNELIGWLQSLPTLLERNDTLIAHAGINILNPKEPSVACNVYGNPTPYDRRHGSRWWEMYDGNQLVVWGTPGDGKSSTHVL